MAASDLGRVAIAQAIDVFYSIGWYNLIPALQPAFDEERQFYQTPEGHSHRYLVALVNY